MQVARAEVRFDWLVELGGASALAAAAAFAAMKAAPSFDFPGLAAMIASGLGGFVVGMLAMRTVPPAPRAQALPDFAIPPIVGEEVLELTELAEEPLLLDTLWREPVEEIALLLEDSLPGPDPASRVVRLFAGQPTPRELRERIDRHLATGTMHVVREYEGPAPDASDALFAALDELKRSLR